MSDYAKARINMVECQLRTNGITTPDILDSFSTVPREAFHICSKSGKLGLCKSAVG